MVNINIWLVVYQPLWKMMEFVSWGYYSQYMESQKTHVPNHHESIKSVEYPIHKISIDEVKYCGYHSKSNPEIPVDVPVDVWKSPMVLGKIHIEMVKSGFPCGLNPIFRCLNPPFRIISPCGFLFFPHRPLPLRLRTTSLGGTWTLLSSPHSMKATCKGWWVVFLLSKNTQICSSNHQCFWLKIPRFWVTLW